MLFNSLDFALFLPLIFLIYWFIANKNLKLQNLIIVGASYLFYGWWDWRFLSLIIFSTCLDYFVGVQLSSEKSKTSRKVYLWTSILANLGFLAFFKYHNFFLENFIDAFSFFGQVVSVRALSIVLPVGISFYTFQTMSYTIDVYNKKLEPTKDFIAFSAFVCFFPQLVAGPIERASNLLPQFYKKRTVNYTKLVDGCRQILWGLFKKIVIADNCSGFVDMCFSSSDDYYASTLLLGAVLFAFQIYCDFSGYSDIAIGTAKLFGFDLMKNFAFPYFSKNVAQFWRTWHISLSTWFKDYVYIPLGGNRVSKFKQVRNTFIVFILSGFWHGANWTFIFWGFLNALFILPIMLLNKNNSGGLKQNYFSIHLTNLFKTIFTFLLIVFTWIFFRAETIGEGFNYVGNIFSISIFNGAQHHPKTTTNLLILFLICEWLARKNDHVLQNLNRFPKFLRWIIYLILILTIYFLGNNSSDNIEFIYFQF